MTVDYFVEKFELPGHSIEEKIPSIAITIWIPAETKAKYEELQRLSKNSKIRFSRFLGSIVTKTINKSHDDAA